MSIENNISKIAAQIGEPARTKMLIALLGGKALTATELSLEAEITPQTASSHLAKLVDSQLLRVQKQGKHRYFQLRGYQVAELLESLFQLSSKLEHSTTVTGPKDPAMRVARICYDHLAGSYSVGLLDALKYQGLLEDNDQQMMIVTVKGVEFFEVAGINFNDFKKSRRPICRRCLDWSERKDHLAGSLGQWILNDVLNKKWAKKDPDSRIVRFSVRGLSQFRQMYGINEIV